MASTIKPYTPAGVTTTTPTPGTTGTFPTQNTSTQGVIGPGGEQVNLNMTVPQFQAAYNISSTDLANYIDTSGGKSALNANAQALIQFVKMDSADRQTIQEALVNASLLPATDANGELNASSTAAFKTAIANALSSNQGVQDYLAQYTATAYTGNLISAGMKNAETQIAAPVTATLENPTTLTADISAAFENALGISVDQQQIQQFVNSIQGQDTANALAPHQEAQQNLQQLKSDQSQLSKLGPDDIDTVMNAYQQAVTGSGLPGAGTQAGPVSGAVANPASAVVLPKGTLAGVNAARQAINTKTVNVPNRVGGFSAALHDVEAIGNRLDPLQSGAFLKGIGPLHNPTNIETGNTATGTTHPVTENLPTEPISLANSAYMTQTKGGIFALSQADWVEAKQLFNGAKKYATPGAAPEAVQKAAFTALLQKAYDDTGNWTDAITQVANGTPISTVSTNTHSFAVGIANKVNAQLQNLDQQIQTQSVTDKVTQPDAVAQAAAEAKSSNPGLYYATNAASFGDLLNGMLSGKTNYYQQSGSDYFTGPVNGAATTDLAAAGAATTPAGSTA